MSIWTRLQTLDRRILYVLIAVVLAVPLFLRPASHPPKDAVFPEVLGTYKTIDDVPEGKIVLISNTWSAGTKAENEPQLKALARHMLAKRIKFATFSWNPAGSEISLQAVQEVQKDMNAELKEQGKPLIEYGKDWAHMGYKTGAPSIIAAGIGEDFQKVFNSDVYGTPVKSIEAVNFVKNSKQLGAVVDVTSTGMMGIWMPYLTMPKKIPLIYCPTAVMAVSSYPYLDSGQLKGMLNGVMGAVQYETLVGLGDEPTDASATSWALSAAHIYIIVLILLGNLGYIAARRAGNAGGRLG